MSSDMLNVIGWDIGGVNIKAARLLWQNKEMLMREVEIKVMKEQRIN